MAVVVGFISLIPTVCGIVALVPIAVTALLQGSTVFTDLPNGTFAVLVVAVNLLISLIIWNGVAPKILGDAVNLPLPILLVGVFVGAALGGILGAFLVAPILGPPLGGFIVTYSNWRWMFLLNVPLGIACLVANWLLVQNTHEDRPPASISNPA